MKWIGMFMKASLLESSGTVKYKSVRSGFTKAMLGLDSVARSRPGSAPLPLISRRRCSTNQLRQWGCNESQVAAPRTSSGADGDGSRSGASKCPFSVTQVDPSNGLAVWRIHVGLASESAAANVCPSPWMLPHCFGVCGARHSLCSLRFKCEGCLCPMAPMAFCQPFPYSPVKHSNKFSVLGYNPPYEILFRKNEIVVALD